MFEDFNPEDHADDDLLPIGDYEVAIVKAEMVKTSNDDDMIKLQVQVISGECQGRMVFDQFMWTHATSEKAVQIGRAKLSKYCKALNIGKIQDLSDLCNKPFIAKVGIQKDKSGEYEDKNTIKSPKAKNGKFETATDRSSGGVYG